MKFLKYLFVFTTFFISSAHAKSMVWQVEKNGNKVFIGGTIHLLRAQDVPLPKAYSLAYRQSDQLVLELSQTELMKAGLQLPMVGLYQDDRRLNLVLKPEVFKAFKDFCEREKILLEPYLKMKPTYAGITLAMVMMKREGANLPGIDMRFMTRAKRDGKEVSGLETAQHQINALFNHNTDVNQVVIGALRDAKNVGEMFSEMITATFNGDTRFFEEKFLAKMKGETPELFHSLIKTRNNKWMPKIEAMFETQETEFVLVGGLHLVGDVGVIQQLQKKGYKITQLD